MSEVLLEGLRETRLDNGLRVLVRPVRTAPLVSVWCWYHVGSKNEGPGTTGISHFVEHMNFKGTRNITREQLKMWIERAGGSWNGYTWVDQTTYLETLASDSLDLALRIEAERMHECTYDPAEFESERTVVLSELQGNSNNPAYLLDVEVTAAALRMHPYRWPTIGWQSDLEAMTRDDLYRHYRDWYVPTNATLVVVGDVDVDGAIEAVNRHFGGIPPGAPPPRPKVIEPVAHGQRRVVLERPGTTGYVQVVHPAPAFAHPDFVPLLLADAVLSGGKGINLWSGGFGRGARVTAPLYEALVEPELVLNASTAVLPTEEPYLYGFSATLRDGVEHRVVEDAFEAVLARSRAEPPAAETLARAQRQVLSSMAFESERITEVAHQIGFYATIEALDAFAEVTQRVERVTPEDVQRVCAEYLRPERRTVGWLVPGESS